MGEIDTKPIEPVQVALSLFEEKSDPQKLRPSSSDSDGERERDVECLQRDLANYKLQLEAKDSAYMQLLLELEHNQKTAEALTVLLKNSEVEREKQIEKCNNVKNQVDELELKIKQMADQLLETENIGKQLSDVLDELKVTQTELLSLQTELAAARDAELKATTMAELMEAAAGMEKEESEELLHQISGLHDSLLMAKMEISELERQKQEIIAKKEAEIEIVTATAVQAQEQLEDLRSQLEVVIELEHQLLEKSVHIETLQTEVKQANDALSLMEDSTSDARDELNRLKEDLENQKKTNSEQASYIETLETELQLMKLEMENANDDVGHLNRVIEMLSVDLVKARRDLEEMSERENDAQVEIAFLKAELHKGRSRIAAAEARAQNVQSGFYLTFQQLAVEAEEVKKENQKLKHEVETEEPESQILVNETKGGAEDKNVAHVTTSNQEGSEIETLKKELEAATMKTGEFRARAEHAITRAEAAEKAKAALGQQIRKWQEQKQRRKAALAALREESAPKRFNPPAYDKVPTKYQPLGKVLNMKF